MHFQCDLKSLTSCFLQDQIHILQFEWPFNTWNLFPSWSPFPPSLSCHPRLQLSAPSVLPFCPFLAVSSTWDTFLPLGLERWISLHLVKFHLSSPSRNFSSASLWVSSPFRVLPSPALSFVPPLFLLSSPSLGETPEPPSVLGWAPTQGLSLLAGAWLDSCYWYSSSYLWSLEASVTYQKDLTIMKPNEFRSICNVFAASAKEELGRGGGPW